ncbi:MAG: hypothetical protein GY774_09065 [Planctomycetes bacterium]|nr:hypothetical protein [Planctomycetota bacterium]
MKTRTLFAVIFLGVLLVSSLSMSQETPPPEPPTKEQSIDPNSSESELLTEIVALEYFPVEELRTLISHMFRIRNIYSDRRMNRLIIQVTKEQRNHIMNLIEELDVPDPDGAGTQEAQNVIHRIYMFEIPSRDVDMRPFSMILQTSGQFSSKELLNAVADKSLRISEFLQSDDGRGQQETEILIRGKAASNASLKFMVDRFPDSRIMELKWDNDETFTNNIAAAQYTQLPEQLQKHIIKFLGKDIQTVGYWFGSSSVPGEIEAPIGPWMLNLRLDKMDRNLELRIEVEALKEMSNLFRQLGRDRDDILSNTMTAKIGKPIIIGYNRQSYGTRKTGAMVILMEIDTVQLSEPQKKAFR